MRAAPPAKCGPESPPEPREPPPVPHAVKSRDSAVAASPAPPPLTLPRRRRRWLVKPRMISESRHSAPISSRLGTLRGAPRDGSGGPGSAMEERSAGSGPERLPPAPPPRPPARSLAARPPGPPSSAARAPGLRSLRAARPRAPTPPALAHSAPSARAASGTRGRRGDLLTVTRGAGRVRAQLPRAPPDVGAFRGWPWRGAGRQKSSADRRSDPAPSPPVRPGDSARWGPCP